MHVLMNKNTQSVAGMNKSQMTAASQEMEKDESQMKPPSFFKKILEKRGYSHGAVEEIWKWYDYSERSGVNF